MAFPRINVNGKKSFVAIQSERVETYKTTFLKPRTVRPIGTAESYWFGAETTCDLYASVHKSSTCAGENETVLRVNRPRSLHTPNDCLPRTNRHDSFIINPNIARTESPRTRLMERVSSCVYSAYTGAIRLKPKKTGKTLIMYVPRVSLSIVA